MGPRLYCRQELSENVMLSMRMVSGQGVRF